MFFMYFDIGFYDHNVYILWSVLVISLFTSVQCIFITNTCCDTAVREYLNHYRAILSESVYWIRYYITSHFILPRACQQRMWKNPQLWEMITTVTFVVRLGKAAQFHEDIYKLIAQEQLMTLCKPTEEPLGPKAHSLFTGVWAVTVS